MGIAALVLGIIGVLVSLTIFQDLSIILTILGLVLGIIAITRKNNRKLAVAGVVLSALGLVICFSSESTTTTSGTAITNDTGNGTKKVSVTADKILVEEAGYTKAGDFVVKVTNNNQGSVCISTIKANFKDSNGNFVLSKESNDSFIVIPAETSIYTYFWGYEEDYSQYPAVSYNVELANIADSFAASGIEISSNNTGSQIAVTLKNQTGNEISGAQVNVIYYLGNEIVGAEEGYSDTKTQDQEEMYINVDYPQDKNYNDVSFDRYEVYYINASYE